LVGKGENMKWQQYLIYVAAMLFGLVLALAKAITFIDYIFT